MKTMTHKQLVKKAESWLRNHKCCGIVITERATGIPETPDAIGFCCGCSCLIECKTSLSDFYADKKKSFRQNPDGGIGQERYFMVPKGLISIDKLPDRWGLLEVSGNKFNKITRARIVKESAFFVADKNSEVQFLCSTIRRLEISSCVYVEREPI